MIRHKQKWSIRTRIMWRRRVAAAPALAMTVAVAMTVAILFAVASAPAAAQDADGGAEPASVAPAALNAPTLDLGPEIVVSALDNKEFLPAVAYNSKHKEYLVVWHNEWGGGYRDIYAQRVTATGELKSWFAVSAGANSRAQPSVAYDPQSDRYLVTWVYDVFGNGSDWDVWGRFIPWNGPDSSLTEFVICNWGTTQWNPDVAYAAAQKEFLVVWTNINTSVSVPAYISGRRIFAGGGFPDTKGFTIASDTARPRLRPDITYNLARNEYLVAFDDDIDIFAARIAGNGALIAGGEFKVAAWPDAENRPAAAACAAADQYLVTWQSSTVNKHDIYGYLLSGAGATQKVIHIQGTTLEETSPEVICDPTGRNYLAIWQQEYGLGASTVGWATRRIHPDGQMDGVWGYMGPGDLALPILAAGDVNLLAVWEQKRGSGVFRDIYACLIHMERLFVPVLIK